MVGFFEKHRKQAKAAVITFQPGLYWLYRKLRRGWAEEEMALLPIFCIKGSVVVDVGANHGLFTHYLSRLCKTVHAFEASPRMADLLRRGYSRRGNVTVHEVALSTSRGMATLSVPTFLGLSGYATLEKRDLASKIDLSDGLQEIQVPTQRLDDFELRDVSFIKVDVEGHEQEVLEGATETLKREAAIVLAELEDRHRKGAVRDVGAFMEGLGYQGFFLRNRKLVGISAFSVATHQDESRPQDYVRNFIFAAPTRVAGLVAELERAGYQLA